MASSITLWSPARTLSPSRGAARTSGAGEAPGRALRAQAAGFSPCWALSTPACGSFHSPFEVKVGTECGNQKVRAWGPGLEGGVVGKSADFVVEAIGDDVGTLGELEAGDRG